MSWQKNRLLERVPAFSCVTRTFVPLCRPFDDLQRASVLRVTTCVCRNEFMRMGVEYTAYPSTPVYSMECRELDLKACP